MTRAPLPYRRLRSAVIGILCAALWLAPGIAEAGDAGDAGNGLQIAGTFVGVAQPELGMILTMTGQFLSESDPHLASDDPTQALSKAIQGINSHLGALDSAVGALKAQSNDLAIAQAVETNRGTFDQLQQVNRSLVDNQINLRVLRSPPLSDQRDLNPARRGATSVYMNDYHVMAFGGAQKAMQEADAFLGLGYAYAKGCGYTGLVPPCATANRRWMLADVMDQTKEDVDASGQRHSYAQVASGQFLGTMRLQPEVGLGSYTAALSLAIAAMELDLGHVDMATQVDPLARNYFQSRYAHIFDRHIGFLTFTPPYDGHVTPAYLNGAQNNLANSCFAIFAYADQVSTQSVIDPQACRLIDKLRDLLRYVSVHGTRRGWSYQPPHYISYLPATRVSSGRGGRPPMQGYDGTGPRREPSVQPTRGPDDVIGFLIGATADGGVYQLSFDGHSLTQSTAPAGRIAGPRALAAAGGYDYYAVGADDTLVIGSLGSPHTNVLRRNFGTASSIVRATFGGGDGTLYSILSTGLLMWSQPTIAPNLPWKEVGQGWQGMRSAASAGKGIIYALTEKGELLWYQHTGYETGAPTWSGPITLASNWGGYQRIAAASGGVIIGITADGRADYYHHRDYLTGVSGGAPHGSQSVRSYRQRDGSIVGPMPHIIGPQTLTGTTVGGFVLLAGGLDARQSNVIK